MKNHKQLSVLLTALVLATFLLGVLPAPVFAKRWTPPPAPTVLVMPAPRAYNLGEDISLYALLRDTKGNALIDRAVELYIDFNYAGQSRTDVNGNVSYQSRKNLPAGDHTLTVRYPGDKDFLPTALTRKLTVLPSVLTVQTLPPLAGITYTLGDREFVSGPDGIARFTVNQAGRYTLSVETDKYTSSDTKIEFGRWEMEGALASRDVDIPSSVPIQAGLNVFHRAGQSFLDLDGIAVDKQRVSKITIKSIQGDVFSSPDGALTWLPASRIARLGNGLNVTPLQYSVMNVTVDGSNVVNQAQQRFFVKPEEVWNVSLLLYALRISTQDALFGSPVGKEAQVEFPNGEVHTYPLDPTGVVEIHSLARGIYRIQVIGVKGMISPTPVALSRNQEVPIRVITNKDMAIAGSLGLIIGLGLLLLGRPWLLLPGLRHKNPVHKEQLEPEAEGYVSIYKN